MTMGKDDIHSLGLRPAIENLEESSIRHLVIVIKLKHQRVVFLLMLTLPSSSVANIESYLSMVYSFYRELFARVPNCVMKESQQCNRKEKLRYGTAIKTQSLYSQNKGLLIYIIIRKRVLKAPSWHP